MDQKTEDEDVLDAINVKAAFLPAIERLQRDIDPAMIGANLIVLGIDYMVQQGESRAAIRILQAAISALRHKG
jgi:hypothetical protein